MDINGLPADLAEFVQQELQSGKYTSEKELVCEALRLLRERERRIDDLREEILPALDRLNRREGKTYDEDGLRQMADDVKSRGRQRLAARQISQP
jgi:antitoxin ParD1/3/4